MPEGDTIHRAAAGLRKVLKGKRILNSAGCDEVLGTQDLNGTRSLDGRLVTEIEARGKHLMIHFDDNRVLHSHMGMNGSWHIYRVEEPWQKPQSRAAVTLQTARWCAVCFTPKVIELVTRRQLLRNDYLQRLGPDILGPPIPDEVTVSRFRTQNSAAVGEAVMKQSVICGVGNVYKSEVLFAERIHPLTVVGRLADEHLLQVRDRCIWFMKRNLTGKPRQTRFGSDGPKLWVYGRRGQDCLKCSSAIQLVRQGDLARSTYYCPSCQKLAGQAAAT